MLAILGGIPLPLLDALWHVFCSLSLATMLAQSIPLRSQYFWFTSHLRTNNTLDRFIQSIRTPKQLSPWQTCRPRLLKLARCFVALLRRRVLYVFVEVLIGNIINLLHNRERALLLPSSLHLCVRCLCCSRRCIRGQRDNLRGQRRHIIGNNRLSIRGEQNNSRI